MTRILTYNILIGGTRRVDQITNMIRAARPDVVGLVEAYNPRVVEQLAGALGMDFRMSGDEQHRYDYHTALLSRLPIVSSHQYRRSHMNSRPTLEVCVREEDGRELTIFVAHLQASFSDSARGGDSIRREEARELLSIMEPKRGTPHLLMGDFNSIAPGDTLQGSRLLRYLIALDQRHKQVDLTGHPNLESVVPPALRFLYPLLERVPRSRLLSALFDAALSLYTARGTIRLLRKAGYIDSYRYVNPHSQGFTCPASFPAGRIDYIMASPELASRLLDCSVLSEGDGVYGFQASDHLPVVAEFGEPAHITCDELPPSVVTAEPIT
jgi:endonuclease/exonuclease/phosphatase family metal-dependent hydrolase